MFRVEMCIILFFVIYFGGSVNSEKRLLLNDPDVINGRLTKLEQTVAQMMNEKSQQEAKFRTLETTVATLQQHSTSGSTYTRWGKKTCPSNNGTDMVYTGYAAGGIRTDSGGNEDLICLTTDVQFGLTSAYDYGRVYVAEFDNAFFAQGEDVPCAVCHTTKSTSTVMIPGRKTCYSGWKMEYHGYLASGYHGHSRGVNYVCIDIKPDYLAGGEANTNNGPLLGPVVGKCGTLQCPPYHDNYPLTCVVCSK